MRAKGLGDKRQEARRGMRGEWQALIKEEGRGAPGSEDDSHRRSEMGSQLGDKGLDGSRCK